MLVLVLVFMYFGYSLVLVTDRFHCHATKNLIGNRPVEEAKKLKCYKRLICKQFFQVSGLCGPQFLSYLPKRFTHLYRALYGGAIKRCTNMAAGNQQKQLDSIPIFVSRTVKLAL